MIIKRYSRQLVVGTFAFCLLASSLSLSAKEWRFADSALTWEAVADCTLVPTPEGLKCTATGRDPHLKTQVDLPAGWNKITVDATAKGRLAGQFFWATREAGFGEQQSVPFDVRPGGSQPKRFQFDVFVSPKLPITELRFDPMSRKGQLVIHSITVSQEQPPQPQATSPESIRVPEGFAVELIYSVPNADQGSWVNMTTDPKGRLITSDQYGKLYRITPPAIGSDGEAQIEQLDVDMGMCQGLLCAFDSLYAVVNGNANQGAGLYRLQDTNGDDQYDQVKLLRAFEGGGEHGPHAVILSPDGKSLYVCGGNHTKIPKPELSRVPRNWQEDQLLPRMWDAGGHAVGILAPGGWICRTDPEGETWELISIGFRNEYDIAFSPEGELFTYDADMEWDVGSPWYRPTRVNHVTSGSEFGWRSGTGKWPEYYPDSLGSVVDIGPGSPTGIVFGTGAKFPEAYQRALFISDWSYGIIYAVHLTESGATYTGEAEQFCAAPALQVSDVIVNPMDGALYFTIGGRRTQSGLYRVTYVGDESTDAVEANKVGTAIQMRRRLEQLHDGKNENTVELAMPMIGVEDRQLRFAARIALENRPVGEWRGAIEKANEPRAIVNLAIALARCGEPSDQSSVLQSLGKIDWEGLDEGQKLDLLRAYGLALIRLGGASDDVSKQISAKFAPHYPNDSTTLNLELCRLLVAVNDSSAAAKTVALLENAPTQEEQIHYALCLRALEAGWDQKLRTRYFEWFLEAASLRGGNSFSRFLSNIRDEAIQKMDPKVKEALAEVLDRKPEPVDTLAELKARPFVKKWTVQDLLQVAEDTSGDRDLARGEEVFATAQCYKCHRYAGKGGIVGPDLTAIGRRFNTQNLLESLIEPSKVISDQYAATLFLLDDGQQISGRVVNLNGENYRVQSDMLNPGNLQNVNRNHIEEMSPSTVSMMPEGLLDTFTKDEILDMLAYMRSATADPDALKKK